MKDAFDRYAPFIQEYIYRKQWTDLRDVQKEACEAILDTDQHVMIASGTASGKTEAAFFPVLTSIWERPSKTISVIYIGPLKALINDQFERLNDLLRDSYIPVCAWHGDSSQSEKKKLLAKPEGVLQITPEALEALLMRHEKDMPALFSDLRFVIIDEIHALMGTDRGLQVLCQLKRLSDAAGCRPRRIGLSATLNDYAPALEFLAAGDEARGAQAVGITVQPRKLSLAVQCFDLDTCEEDAMPQFLYQYSHDKKCLIFTNSRMQAEATIAALKSIAAQRGDPDIFYVHHGSVSAMLRKETETVLRDSEGAAVAAATLTLELGIDIGDLDGTVQTGAPHSCAGFVQRIGRSGRRTGKPQMLFASEYSPSGVDEELPWELLQQIAVINLYMQEHFVEPFMMKAHPFSLAIHQTLSILMAKTELTPADLARTVLTLPPLKDRVTLDDYREILRHMVELDLLHRMDDGKLIIGMAGEKITNYYTFYAVFKDETEWTLKGPDGEVGTVGRQPVKGQQLNLAGRNWEVTEVDTDHRKALVEPAPQGTAPVWLGGGGSIHHKIAEKIRDILASDETYDFLSPQAQEMLDKARKEAKAREMCGNGIRRGADSDYCWYPWTGTREMETIYRLVKYGLSELLHTKNVRLLPFCLTFDSDLNEDELRKKLACIEIDPEDPDLFLDADELPDEDKYDIYLPDALRRRAYLANELDAQTALSLLAEAGNGEHVQSKE